MREDMKEGKAAADPAGFGPSDVLDVARQNNHTVVSVHTL